MIWLALAASAAPPGFVPRGEAHGCALFLGPTEADGVVPMRAECRWPERTADDVAAVLGDPLEQLAFARVVDVEILERRPDRLVVWQRHEVGPLPDREVVVDWFATREPDGGRTWRWSTADAPLPRVVGNVPCERWDGAWSARPDGHGGVLVSFDSAYDAGEFPAWLVRPFLTSRLAESVADLRATAAR